MLPWQPRFLLKDEPKINRFVADYKEVNEVGQKFIRSLWR
jgi:hypothetical protein